MADEATGSLLIVLLETHAAAWPALAAASPSGGAGVAPAAFIAQVGAFVGSYELEAEGNEVVVLAVHSGCCPLLYQSPSRRTPGDDDGTVLPGTADPTIADALAAGVAALLEADSAPTAPQPPPPPALAAALASALCIAARECPSVVEVEDAGTAAPAAPPPRTAPPPRILVLAAAAHASAGDAYVPVMNAVFAAQRLGVAIDVALLAGASAGVLAPAPHLTHGVLHTPRDRTALVAHLVSVFAPSATARARLALPRATAVDLGASCFCHATRVDVGHVCSVCLSIWCEPVPACATCGSEFGAGPGAGSKRPAE